MSVKVAFLLLLVAVMLIHDLPRWGRTGRRDRLAYAALMLPMLYLGFLYVTDVPWPNLDEAIDYIFGEPARRLVESLKVPS
ncbi:hypothetical protein ACFFNY_26000 [Paenibacillus hodogayensis]|uniref:Uncharacterized protein n=1 Tax=Paenibacillus hodogayensis TaxID=279208 RepID=A0ABV5W395_9BACL